jgi:soluble lytic murein transglycosylase-like protein
VHGGLGDADRTPFTAGTNGARLIDIDAQDAAPFIDLAAPIAAVPVPSMFVTTAAGGPAYEYVRRSAVTSGATAFVPTAILTLEDAWSAAFFGDKQRLAAFIEHTATVNGLPVEFLLRLLRQESGLNYQAVSRTGAQGIAQFMPRHGWETRACRPVQPVRGHSEIR